MLRKISLLMVALILVVTAASCAGTTKTVTQTKNVTVSTTITSANEPVITSTKLVTLTLAPAPTITGTPTTTAGAMAAIGDGLFEANCTETYCHASYGPNGAVGSYNSIPAEQSFSKLSLSFFKDAQNLFVFTKSFMKHPGAPALLTDEQYSQIIAFVLIKNSTLQSTDIFGLGNMATIKLNP
jgi:hypothetical protein